MRFLRVIRTEVDSQLRNSSAPASLDFSGWNWVAHNGPFSTAATNRSPCTAQVTVGAANRPPPSASNRSSSVGVDEVEPLVRDAAEQDGLGLRCNGRPAHVRHDRSRQPVDNPRPLAEARRAHTVLVACLEHDLHPDADPEHGPAPGQTTVDHLVTAHPAQARHARREGSDARNHEPVGTEGGVEVGGQRRRRRRHVRARAPRNARCRSRSRGRPRGVKSPGKPNDARSDNHRASARWERPTVPPPTGLLGGRPTTRATPPCLHRPGASPWLPAERPSGSPGRPPRAFAPHPTGILRRTSRRPAGPPPARLEKQVLDLARSAGEHERGRQALLLLPALPTRCAHLTAALDDKDHPRGSCSPMRWR